MMCVCFSIVPECYAFIAPSYGAVLNPVSTFIPHEVQTIKCDAGFRAQGVTEFTCADINATTAEWQPVPGSTVCGKVYM